MLHDTRSGNSRGQSRDPSGGSGVDSSLNMCFAPASPRSFRLVTPPAPPLCERCEPSCLTRRRCSRFPRDRPSRSRPAIATGSLRFHFGPSSTGHSTHPSLSVTGIVPASAAIPDAHTHPSSRYAEAHGLGCAPSGPRSHSPRGAGSQPGPRLAHTAYVKASLRGEPGQTSAHCVSGNPAMQAMSRRLTRASVLLTATGVAGGEILSNRTGDMAYYLDSGAYGLSDASYAPADDYSVDTVQNAYGIDSTIFSDPGPLPARTAGPSRTGASHSQHDYVAADRARYVPYPRREPVGQKSSLGLSTAARHQAFPLVDGDFAVSPFPVKSLTQDGRLKTKLMGVGHDGGFLTSPIIVGPPRSDSRTGRVGRHEISIDSPILPHQADGIPVFPLQRSVRARSASVSSEMTPSLSMGTTASSVGFTSGAMSSSTSMSAHGSREGRRLTYDDSDSLLGQIELAGLGMGLADLPALDDAALDLFGPSLGVNSSLDLSQPELDNGYVDVAPPLAPPAQESSQNAADIRLTQSGRLVFADDLESAGMPPAPQLYEQAPPRQQPPSARPVKAMPNRSLSKAKSCSALSPSARDMAARSPYYDEPLTPVSAHTSPYDNSFSRSNSASIGSTGTGPVHAVPEMPPPLSFADLYHYGLVQEAALATSIRRSPLNQMPADLGGVGLGMSDSVQRGGSRRPYPPPNGEVSAASTPATGYGIEAAADPRLHYRTPEEPSSAVMRTRPSTGASSQSSHHRLGGPAPVNFSRPRMPSQVYSPAVPSMSQQYAEDFADGRRQTRQLNNRAMRQPADSSVYGQSARNFSYPTRFASSQQCEPYEEARPIPLPDQQHMPPPPPQYAPARECAPEVQWGHPPPQIPLPPAPTTPQRRRINAHARCLTGPAGSMADYPLDGPDAQYDDEVTDEYDRQLATYDALFQPMQLPIPPPSTTAGKRSREAHDDSHYGSPLSPGSEDQRPKRLRSVASAPCLPSRRLKPGPKPKAHKTPEQEHQSVFNATLSPPVPQIHRGASPFSSPLLSDDDAEFPALDANGQIATTSTITYVPGPPALPGQPRSSVPREVIQSLYSHIPTHVTSSGVKVPKRYACLIEGCDRSFPRKSAIESHIQTHLEDKPFICPHEDW